MRFVRRGRLATAAVSAAVIAAGVLAGATAASAADSLNVDAWEFGLTLPAGVTAPGGARALHIMVSHDLDGHLPSATVTVDTTGLTGVADVVWPAECTHAGAVGTCTADVSDLLNSQAPDHYLVLGLSAAAGAKDGAHGSIGLKAETSGLQSQENSVDIAVGSGADLTIDPLAPVSKAKVGSTVPAPIRWANTGNETAPSTVLTLQTIAGLDFVQRYSNCAYSTSAGPDKTVTAVCTIDTPLEPGKALQLSPQLTVRVTSEAWYTFLSAQVLPPGEQTQATLAGKGGTQGSGPRLTAEPVPAGQIAPLVAELNPRDNYTELVVQADNHAHFAAIGAQVRGDKGATVPVTVGMRNDGPALILDRSGGEVTDFLKVTFPSGTTVTKIPSGCSAIGGKPKDHGPYDCSKRDSYIQAPGYKAQWTFQVRLDQQLTDARGTAALTNPHSDMTGDPVTFAWDTSTDGYTAPIVFNGADGSQGGTGTQGSTGSSSAATNNPGTDGQSLAATGGGSHTPLIAGGAAALLAAGAASLVAARRRRTAAQR